MANNILSVIWITDQHWSYYYLLIGFLLLIICFLLYRLRQLKKNIGKEQDYYHSLFDILDNLPFPIMVKDIQNSFRYYYWNKESELQSGIKREEAIGCTDYEIYGEERGRKYRDVDESLVQADKIYRAEESYSTVDGAVHDTIAVKSIIKWKEKKKWLLVTRWDITRLKTYERELIAAKEELEKALNKQKLALKSVNFGLIYIDKNYLVQWEETTQIASLVKGRHYTPGQICYKTSALRDTPCEQCAFQKAIEQGKIIRHTIQIDQVDFEVTATPVYDNEGIEIIGGLLRFEDITEKVKMDKMLQEAKEKAEREKFLLSMGMDRKERKKMNKREWYIYWIVPTIILIISTILFMRDTMTARMYPDDIRKICELQEAVVIAVWIVINGIYFWIMNRKARRG